MKHESRKLGAKPLDKFPRLKGWGLIEAALNESVQVSSSWFPRLKGWGLIEALAAGQIGLTMIRFPRLKGWGLIEAFIRLSSCARVTAGFPA